MQNPSLFLWGKSCGATDTKEKIPTPLLPLFLSFFFFFALSLFYNILYILVPQNPTGLEILPEVKHCLGSQGIYVLIGEKDKYL